MSQNPTKVQSILFERENWSVKSAKEWLREHGFVAPKVDATERFFRFRQFEPSQKKEYRTITFSEKDGIKAIIEVDDKSRPNPKTIGKKMNPKHEKSIDGKVILKNIQGLRKMVKGKSFIDAAKLILETLKKLDHLGVEATGIAYSKEFDFQTPQQDFFYNVAAFDSSMGSVVLMQVEERPLIVFYSSDLFENLFFKLESDEPDPFDLGEVFDDELPKMVFKIEKGDLGKINPHCQNPAHQNPHCRNPHCRPNPRQMTPRQYLAQYEKSNEDDYYHDTYNRGLSVKVATRLYELLKKSKSAKSKEIIEMYFEDDDFDMDWDDRGLSPRDTREIYKMLNVKMRTHLDKDNPHCRPNPHCAGLAMKFNPKKIMNFDSFMDNLTDGNVFVGRYVIYIQDGKVLRLEVGSSSPKVVSPQVAFFADLAGQAELVGISEVDAFSDSYRELIRDAKQSATDVQMSEGIMTTDVKDVPFEPIFDVTTTIKPYSPLPIQRLSDEEYEKLAKEFKAPEVKSKSKSDDFLNESALDNAKFVVELIEGIPEHAKREDTAQIDVSKKQIQEIFKRFMKKDLPFTKDVLKELQKAAGSKRLRSLASLLKRTLERIPKSIEQETGLKVDVVDDKGKKSTASKEATKDTKDVIVSASIESEQPSAGQSALEAQLAQIQATLQKAQKGVETLSNPRMMHYAYPMTTADHNHLYSEYELYEYQYAPLKKNPDHDRYRFPVMTISDPDGGSNFEIDNDIFKFIDNVTGYESILPIPASLSSLKQLAPQFSDALQALADQAQGLTKTIAKLMNKYQTVIVPNLEKKVLKQLKEGKTLSQIRQEAKERTEKSKA